MWLREDNKEKENGQGYHDLFNISTISSHCLYIYKHVGQPSYVDIIASSSLIRQYIWYTGNKATETSVTYVSR